MKKDLEKYAERKMPVFNLVVSIITHHDALKNTIGTGFTQSVFTHSEGTCNLHASKQETALISARIKELIQQKHSAFKVWYLQAKKCNKEADNLLEEYRTTQVSLTPASYAQAEKIFIENFSLCTILPYWILYAIDDAFKNGEPKETYSEVLAMFEELKSESRYPLLGQLVMEKYFIKAGEILHVSPRLASCLAPYELGQVLAGKEPVEVPELEKRMKQCAVVFDEKTGKAAFVYDGEELRSLVVGQGTEGVTELKGSIAFKGVVRGRVRIVNSMSDMEKFEKGDILVSIQSNPSLMPAIIKSSALVTDEGGIMCHASVISRELKKPCIIGTKIATKVLKDGDMVEVDAEKGVVRILKTT